MTLVRTRYCVGTRTRYAWYALLGGVPAVPPSEASASGTPEVDEEALWRSRLRDVCRGCGCRPIGADGRCSKCGATKRHARCTSLHGTAIASKRRFQSLFPGVTEGPAPSLASKRAVRRLNGHPSPSAASAATARLTYPAPGDCRTAGARFLALTRSPRPASAAPRRGCSALSRHALTKARVRSSCAPDATATRTPRP